MRIETLAVHAGFAPDPTTGAVAPPLHLSTTFARDRDGVPLGGHVYVRESNPTQDALEAALAPLEGGAAALAFASGMAAGAALLQALPKGSHVVLPDDVYYGYRVAGVDFFREWGIETSSAAMEKVDSLRGAIRRETRLVWIETPSNPLMKVVDVAAAVSAAHEAGALAVVDNTFATPVLQRPLELGADVALHSTTKYFGGHSDVQGGALVFRSRDPFFERVLHARHVLGAVSSPFNSWLVLRGVRSLAVRVAAQSATALKVAEALAAHPAVARVNYPGLPGHPGHEAARRQMKAFGGMLSFHAAGGRDAALRAVGRAELFVRATSLGGVESLIEHRATSEGPASTTPQDLVRLSIGLEHADDLIADLQNALSG